MQSPKVIADTLKLAGIGAFWDTVSPKKKAKSKLQADWNWLIRRRNQIAHEGDRMTSRKSGKNLRSISRNDVGWAMGFATGFVQIVEAAFPS